MASAPPYSASLGNVQVLFNNVAAPLASVSSNLILAIVPYETTAAVAQIQVINNGAMSNVVTEFVNATTPGVFTNPAGGTGNAVAMHGDGSAVTPDSPAAIGETITVLVAGLGDVLPAIADGSAGTSGSATFNTIFAGVGSVPATNVSAGLAPNLVGYYQVMLTIPSGVTAGNNFLYIGGPDSISSEAIISIAGP
jgi:uncharacterized protein (TIGR03437 family)